jgi:hypothetical protein
MNYASMREAATIDGEPSCHGESKSAESCSASSCSMGRVSLHRGHLLRHEGITVEGGPVEVVKDGSRRLLQTHHLD